MESLRRPFISRSLIIMAAFTCDMLIYIPLVILNDKNMHDSKDPLYNWNSIICVLNIMICFLSTCISFTIRCTDEMDPQTTIKKTDLYQSISVLMVRLSLNMISLINVWNDVWSGLSDGIIFARIFLILFCAPFVAMIWSLVLFRLHANPLIVPMDNSNDDLENPKK